MTSDFELAARRIALRTVNAVPFLRHKLLASCDYQVLSSFEEFEETSVDGWSNEKTASKQHRIWRNLIDAALENRPREDISLVINSIASKTAKGDSVIEIGCGSGYFSEVVKKYAPGVTYTGLDYSKKMIQLANSTYPDLEFIEGSASDTGLPNDSFDLVLDGAALIHIPVWRMAIQEYFRISRHCVLLSSLTLHEGQETVLMRKRAYGAPVFEQAFARKSLDDCISLAGGKVVERHRSLNYDLQHEIGIKTTSETWVCELV